MRQLARLCDWLVFRPMQKKFLLNLKLGLLQNPVWVSWGLYLSFPDLLQYPLLSAPTVCNKNSKARWGLGELLVQYHTTLHMCITLCLFFCIHLLIWTSRPWLKEQVGRACGPSLPFQRQGKWDYKAVNALACPGSLSRANTGALLLVLTMPLLPLPHSCYVLKRCWPLDG